MKRGMIRIARCRNTPIDKSAVDDEVDEAKRLHQPDRGAEHQTDGQHDQQRLAQHVAREALHARIIKAARASSLAPI